LRGCPNEARLGPTAAAEIASWLRDEGVRLELGTELESLVRQGPRLQVHAGATHTTADVVVMATGVSPRSELVGAGGIELVGGAVPTDASMRTAVPDLLAAGDVCMAFNTTAGRRLRVEHWGDALIQGELAGRSAAGEAVEWDQVPGFWSTIGEHTLKFAAWGDGYDESRFERGPGGGFSAWYGREGRVVGVLAHELDAEYERGRQLIAEGAPWL
jgi:NADPH-dependent 2,4-dienoyl-CoA reductase/sulfur reductase-like enzyme